MFKDTCLVALKRKDQSSRRFGLESFCILDLEVFVHFIFLEFEILTREILKCFQKSEIG
jgi:hypothetical protein